MATVELKLNINSYVTVEEADDYINTHYSDESPEYEKWFNSGLSDENKKRALINSTSSIDNLLRFKGAKLNNAQSLQFPRRFNISTFPIIYPLLYVSQQYDNTLVSGVSPDGSNGLNQAKEATIVNAIAGIIINPKLISEVNKRVLSGITSKSEGSVSASFDTSDEHTRYLQQGIYNIEKIRSIFKSWLSGSMVSL